MVGGLGLSARHEQAIEKLPGPSRSPSRLTARELDTQAPRARAEGHEVLLQVPMEPFDYPDTTRARTRC